MQIKIRPAVDQTSIATADVGLRVTNANLIAANADQQDGNAADSVIVRCLLMEAFLVVLILAFHRLTSFNVGVT